MDVFSGVEKAVYLFSVLGAWLKVFLCKIFCIVILVTVPVCWEYRRTEKRVQSFKNARGAVEFLAKAMVLLRQVPEPAVIIAGDSKAERGVDPSLFLAAGKPAINLAMASIDLVTLVNNLEIMEVSRRNLLYIFSVGAYQANDGNNEKDRFWPEFYFNMTPMERLTMFKGNYFLHARNMLKKFDLYQHYGSYAAKIAQEWGPDKYLGWVPIGPAEVSCMRIRHGDNVSPYNAYKDINVNGARWRQFREAVLKISSWPGKFVLFNGPQTKKGLGCIAGTYAEDMEREFSRKVKELVDPLPNVRFVDVFWDSPVPENRFYDPGHLDKNGAAEFTGWLIAFLKKESWL